MRSGQYVARRWSPWVGKPPLPESVVAQVAPLRVVAATARLRAYRATASVLRLPPPPTTALAAAIPRGTLIGKAASVPRRPLALILPRIAPAAAVPSVPAMAGARRVQVSDFGYVPRRRRKKREAELPLATAPQTAEPRQTRLAESLALVIRASQAARDGADEAVALVADFAQYKRARLVAELVRIEAERALIEALLLLEVIE